MTAGSPPHLEARGISKHFGALKALDDVSLELAPGTFHALLGENGAGKSTIVKCLMGFYHADAGEIRIDSMPTRIDSPREARRHGMGMVFQHFTLIPSMTVAENLVLARPDLPLVIDWKTETKQLESFLEQAPFRVDLQARVDTLAAGQKQKVEILKELYLKTRLLILDEPTSVLTRNEADEVLGFVRRLVERKQLSVLLITHKFREVMEFCDVVTVLRRGRLAGHGKTAALSDSQMAEMMMGEPRVQKQVARSAVPPGAPVLKIEDLRARGDNGVEVLRGVNLTIRAGEIVGIAGVSGNGQKELIEVIAGQRAPVSGTITVGGELHLPTRDMLRRHQFFTLPEEPLRNAAVARMSVADNMVFGVFDQPPFQRAGFLFDRAAVKQHSRDLIARFSVRPPVPDAPIGDLSGGNVQRAILARELSSGGVRVLVAANPCFGLDFKAVDFIHNLLVETRNNGAAVLLVSEDLDELLALGDRIFVMTNGIVAHETTPADVDLAVIGRQMASH
jgi:general nucleoside transport system ATP-binding protein